MSKGFIDFQIRVSEDDVGRFIMAVATTPAQVVTWGVAVPSSPQVTKKAPVATVKPERAPPLPRGFLTPPGVEFSPAQQSVLDLLAEGPKTRQELADATGIVNIKRVINNLLVGHKAIRGDDEEGYSLVHKPRG